VEISRSAVKRGIRSAHVLDVSWSQRFVSPWTGWMFVHPPCWPVSGQRDLGYCHTVLLPA